jgi:hypothetical protein
VALLATIGLLRVHRVPKGAPSLGGASDLDRRHDLELGEADVPAMSRPPGRSVPAEDVGDLERGAYGGQPPGPAPSPICAVILPSGLVTVRTTRVATRV